MSHTNILHQIMAQTTYSEDEAYEKLQLFNNDPVLVIKDYLGVPQQTHVPRSSINQEIFKQIRQQMDTSMNKYRLAHPIDMNQLRSNIQESEFRKHNKEKN